MHIRTKSLTTYRLAGAAFAVWLCGIGWAWAGDGGADAGTVQGFLTETCGNIASIFSPAQPVQTPCPQLPTVSQGVLEIAALLNARPEAIRSYQNVQGSAIYAGNPVIPSPPVVWSSVTPLAFIGAPTSKGQATPTQLNDPKADSYFYAVATLDPVSQQPGTLNLLYDYLLRTVPVFIKGQTVAKISLPLAVLRPDGSELAVCGALGCPASVATLTIKATCTGGPACLTGYVTGDFAGTGTLATYKANDVGISFTASFGKSPISALPHASFAVQVPLVVTNANEPAYFGFSWITGNETFSSDETGASTPVLGAGVSVGIPPYAAPLCANPAGTACPTPPAPPPPSTYGFCASFSNNFTGPIGNPAPAVAAYVQLVTDGETLASTPLLPLPPGSVPASCPF
jgi:hypothetical protein